MIFVFGGYTIYAQSSYDFEALDSFYLIQGAYHDEMNEYFNSRFEELNKLLENPDFYDIEKHPEFHPPQDADIVNESLASLNKKCNPEDEPANLSSFCVSLGATEIYIAYVSKLELFKSSMGVDFLNYAAIIQELSERGQLIIEEVEKAKEVLEATVSAYNEYRLAYPMHKKYEEIIENLIKYRGEMKEIHRKSVEFPAKFIDASTSQCS